MRVRFETAADGAKISRLKLCRNVFYIINTINGDKLCSPVISNRCARENASFSRMIVEPSYNERQKSFIILRELSKKNFLLFSLLNTSSTEYYTNDTKNFQNIQIALLIKPYRKREMKLYFRKKKKILQL